MYLAYPVMIYPHLYYYLQEGLRRTIESYPHLRADATMDGTSKGKLLISSVRGTTFFFFFHKSLDVVYMCMYCTVGIYIC